MKLSVAMCTYNGSPHVSEQLESIASQIRPPEELVVCDDCSTDDTMEMVRRFTSRSPFELRSYTNESQLGSTKNFERAIGLCSGDLIALSDQDDVWLPEKIQRIRERFSASPHVGLVFSDAEIVDESLRPLGERLWDKVGFGAREQRLLRSERAVDVLLPGWLVTGATMAFRTKFRDLVLDIPDDLKMIHDGWIALVVAGVSAVDFIPEALVNYRQHPRQQIGAPDKVEQNVRSVNGFVEAARRETNYGDLIKIVERVRERLLTRGALSVDDKVIRMLEARLTHLRARNNLPASSLARAQSVLKELLTGRYQLYSNGVYSAIKDLLD